ncbi:MULTISPECIES: alpha/beta fold hydrolase [Xanthomonas]|uniref:alpha/beta fold hydrolase n=1 Tax=Xanthomonas TaxID=338 RepID=UPI0004958F7E|nr:alpha/beta hydrolase [Xanthomonas campestris]AKS15538.1 peroxidase [Xanthomonas campestris pv. campestris]MBD8246733.1 alpha/beta hydrolase [Xanthomonas campestris]MCC5045130.1 alpha/beta hydrolase [Xanthomonas campestris]MCC5077329.1 alpha/beta hydrolase [Xanthomonas campestris pv. campestris]MCD0252272.1 alpha/beta hydrolase [Xanthomonas campestris pv. campestris]
MVSHPSSLAETASLARISVGDASLAVSRRGAGNAPTVLLAHGFGQTRHAWEATATALAEAGYQALSFDARGHGDSSINPASLPYSAAQFTDDLIVLAGELPEPPVLVAASMGGLFGLLAEARWPGLFRAIVLVDITPRWDTTGVERILRFMTAHPQGFASLDAAADAIAAYLPQRPRKSAAQLQLLLRQRSDGQWHWHWDPRLVSELAGQDSQAQQQALMEAAAQVRCPMLLISGGRSDLVTPQTITEFLSIAPHAQHVQLPHATHMLAGDDNTTFTATVLHYLDALPSVGISTASNITEHVTGARP